jgi:hypothetical protein
MKVSRNYSLEDVASKLEMSHDHLRNQVVSACWNARLRVRRDKAGEVLVPVRLALYILWKNKVLSEDECYRRIAFNELMKTAESFRKQKVYDPESQAVTEYVEILKDTPNSKVAAHRRMKNLEVEFRI